MTNKKTGIAFLFLVWSIRVFYEQGAWLAPCPLLSLPFIGLLPRLLFVSPQTVVDEQTKDHPLLLINFILHKTHKSIKRILRSFLI
ncbi:MAG: hypothetical protein ACD_76C00161G0006 [uncultured bacterium]|nr:MAG: hypothetical protein ACD_76C00161G0006 [uncultured bacterium]HBD05410.1 hypothetical protein [Candidatus Uhrbacteria bacterium]